MKQTSNSQRPIRRSWDVSGWRAVVAGKAWLKLKIDLGAGRMSNREDGAKIPPGGANTNANSAMPVGADVAANAGQSRLAAVLLRQQVFDRYGSQAGIRLCGGQDNGAAGGEIREHFAADATGGDDFSLPGLFPWAGGAHGDDGGNGGVARAQGPA